MHEVRLNEILVDYLTGESIENTTYEDLRQALARMLVEEKKYPRNCLRPKVSVPYSVDGEQHFVMIDIGVYDAEGKPLLALFFCPGEIGSFVRESLAAARLHAELPFPLIAVTDSMTVVVVATAGGVTLGEGWYALPGWDVLAPLAAEHQGASLSPERREKESRIALAYEGLGGPCCGDGCGG